MKRNNFNLSHTHLLTARFGELVPIACQEVIPGDTFRMSSSLLVRMAPMLAPVMTPIKVRVHHWYVPYRILDPNWESFIVDNNSNIVLPELGYNNQDVNIVNSKGKGTLLDYMGIFVSPDGPTTTNANRSHLNAYPFMAYDMIWNEFYRDEDLQEERTWSVSSSNIISVGPYLKPAKVAWRKDRFTTSRPWTQKGDQVFVPTFSASTNKEWKEVTFTLTKVKLNYNLPLPVTPSPFETTGKKNFCAASTQHNNALGLCPIGANTASTGDLSNFSAFWSKAPDAALRRLFTAKFPNWAAVKAYIDNPANPTTFTLSGKGIAADYAGVTGVGNIGNWDQITCTFTVRIDIYNRQGPNSPTLEQITYTNNKVYAGGVNPLALQANFKICGVFGDEMTQSGAMSIRDLRLASSLQRFQENRAKWGSRYIEYLQYLGIKSSDARLQMPEYLGGGSQYLQTSEVLQTAPGESGVVGSMYGHGIGAMRSNRFTKFFEEHGILLTLMSIVPDTGYAQGTKRFFFKKTWADFFQKDLQDIGMQEVYNGEVFTINDRAIDYDTFGYQDRYNEYRKEQSYISGDFHDTLSHWHLFRMFDQTPALNASFIECNPSMRIFADQKSDPFWIYCRHSVVAKRMISKRANTKLR